MLLRISFLPFLGCLISIVTAYTNPKTCKGTCTNTHDPSIIRRSSDGTYFRFSTGGLIPIHTAPSISGPWKFACNMLSSNAKTTTQDNNGKDLWAPDVSLVGDTYYVYYTVSTFGSQNSKIGLATSKTMDCGSFRDLGYTGISSITGSAYNAIDAQLLNDDGIYRLQMGSFVDDIFQIIMADPPVRPDRRQVSMPLAFDPAGIHPMEGSFLIKQGGYYYLFFSYGICCGYDKSRPAAGSEYKIKVCRSESPSSGFVDASGESCRSVGGTVVLESHGHVYGPGGQSVYKDPTHGWIIVYHYVDTTIGYADGDKRFGWNKLNFSSGWPTV